MPGPGRNEEWRGYASFGRLANGTAQFHGGVGEVRVPQVLRTDDWLKTAYQNLVDAKGSVSAGRKEEAGYCHLPPPERRVPWSGLR